jgi:hypothetical protein
MSRRPDVPLSSYGVYVRRHAALVALCMAVGALIGYATSHRIATYVGTAAVLAPPLDLGPHGVPGQPAVPIREKDAVTPDTEAQVATSSPVLDAVRAATKSHVSDAQLAKRITVDAPPNTRVLTISYNARQPKVAVAGAQAAATAFIRLRERLIADRQAADVAALTAQIDALRDDLGSNAEATVTGSQTSRVTAQLAEDAITEKMRSLERLQIRLQSSATDAGTILRPATATAVRARLGREVPVTSGALIGVLIGLLLARLRPRPFLAPRDLTESPALAEPVDVVAVGPISVKKRRRSQLRRAARDSGLRRLRNMDVAAGHGLTVLTGPARGPVTGVVAAALARTLAALGDGVALLIPDGDPTLLEAVHASPRSLRDLGSDTVTTGQAAPDPGEVVHYRLPPEADATAAAATLRRAYPHVVVVAPGEPDARVCAMARRADRVVVSAERRRTRVRDVVDAIRRLRIVGAPVAAALLVRVGR